MIICPANPNDRLVWGPRAALSLSACSANNSECNPSMLPTCSRVHGPEGRYKGVAQSALVKSMKEKDSAE